MMVRSLVLAAAIAAAPLAAMAQTHTAPAHKTTGAPRKAGGGQTSGQQQSSSSPTQNQSQMQTDNSQQPPQAKTLPPTASSQTAPNPMPQLAK